MLTPATADTVGLELDGYRRELTAYCYRMLGSGTDAEDAVQETMVRAWRGRDGFEGRSAERTWLYRIATNVCVDLLRGASRRARPVDLGPSSTADAPLGPPLPEEAWVHPIADDRVLPDTGDPAELAAARESVRLAFVAALRHLPPRQRAVLILRDVLCWRASEVAALLETSVASVNSALQRARAKLAVGDPPATRAVDAELLDRYVDAFERYDIDALVSLLREDAAFTMPPFGLWLRGHREISRWYVGQGAGCRGSTLLPVAVNGGQGYAAYKPDGHGRYRPFAIHVIEVAGGRISGLHHFLYPELFTALGLPEFL